MFSNLWNGCYAQAPPQWLLRTITSTMVAIFYYRILFYYPVSILFYRYYIRLFHYASICVQGFTTRTCQRRSREVCCCCCWGLAAGHRWINLRGGAACGSEESDWFGSAADSRQEQASPCHTPHNSLINALRPKIAPLQHEIELNHLDTSGNWLEMSKSSVNDINNLREGKRGKENRYYYDGAASNRTLAWSGLFLCCVLRST